MYANICPMINFKVIYISCLIYHIIKYIIISLYRKNYKIYHFQEKCYGEKLMRSCLKIGNEFLALGYHEDTEEIPDVLSKPVVLKQMDDPNNKFMKKLNTYVKKNEDNLKIQNIQRTTRRSDNVDEVQERCRDEVEKYIGDLWYGIRERLDIADTKDINCTSFSEAPAEGVFSIWEQVTSDRSCLTIEHANAMIRVSKEGPQASTMKAFELSTKALDRWPSHLGERFTTDKWMPGLKSKAVKRCQKD